MKKAISLKYLSVILVALSMIFQVSILNSQTVVQWYTSMGDFRAELREDLVPVTAQNFIDLTNDKFYDGLIFHRVISGFMIQDGCPNGNGTGGPGYTFDDEFHPDLRHDEAGILSMANSGPNTNGSQYFITVEPTEWLDDLHSVFGKVIDGLEVVYEISEVETNQNDKPLVDVVIDSIRVVTGDPAISLTAPLGGMKWNSHIANQITWDSEFIADVKIEVSYDEGSSWTEIVESTSANTRQYLWPAQDIVTQNCMIKISNAANPDVTDITETTFALCNLQLINPNTFDFFKTGNAVDVEWESEDVGDLSISYKTTGDSEWVLIEENVDVLSSPFVWYPEETGMECKIQLKETEYPEVIEESSSDFIVFQLDLTAPEGGEELEGYSVFTITWESELLPNLKIEYTTDNGQTWIVEASDVNAEDLNYQWNVPNLNSEECFVKLSSPALPNSSSVNSTPFTIQKTVTVEDHAASRAEIAIFPNPVRSTAFISIPGDLTGVNEIQLELFNISGQRICFENFDVLADKKNNLELDVSNIEDGIYILKLNYSDKVITKRLIKNDYR